MDEKVISNIPVNVLNSARLCVAGKKEHRDYLKHVLIDTETQEIVATDGCVLYYAWGLKLEGTIKRALISIPGKIIGVKAKLEDEHLVSNGGSQTQFVNHIENTDIYPYFARVLPSRSESIEKTGFLNGFKSQYLTKAERCWGKNIGIRLLHHEDNLVMRPLDLLELLYVMPVNCALKYNTYYGVDEK